MAEEEEEEEEKARRKSDKKNNTLCKKKKGKKIYKNFLHPPYIRCLLPPLLRNLSAHSPASSSATAPSAPFL